MSVLHSLRLIFWGALVVAIPIKLGGNSIGYALVAMGMIDLAKLAAGSRDRWLLRLIVVVAFLNAFMAPFREGPCEAPMAVRLANAMLGIVNVVAAIAFCIVMRRLCELIPLDQATRSWRISLSYWTVGLPTSVGATCLGWAMTGGHGAASLDSPKILLVTLAVLLLATWIVWLHSLVSLGRSIDGLKRLPLECPASIAVCSTEPPVFQFRIRTLMILTAATAVVAAGWSQDTIPYWQFTVAGLVGLSLAARWLEHRSLCNGLLIAVGCVLLIGFMRQVESRTQSGSLCGTSAGVTHSYREEHLLPDSTLSDIDMWLTSKGFQESEPPAEPISSFGMKPREPQVTIWYTGRSPNVKGISVRIQYSKSGPNVQFLDMDYISSTTDFPSVIQEHERKVEQFKNDIRRWWRQYYEEFQKSHANP